MIDMTYDPEADTIYIHLARGKVDGTDESGPFIYDVDKEGRILGVEILAASKVLAPGDGRNARQPGEKNVSATEQGVASISIGRLMCRRHRRRQQKLCICVCCGAQRPSVC
jgi:uncharacterized protein YuzE